MTPSQAGARTEAAVLAALVAAGHNVLLPFAAHQRYDLVIEQAGRFHRVQCKTGRLTDYEGDIDFFGVHCPDTGVTYLVPAAEVPRRGAALRIAPAGNGQHVGIRWAHAYIVTADH